MNKYLPFAACAALAMAFAVPIGVSTAEAGQGCKQSQRQAQFLFFGVQEQTQQTCKTKKRAKSAPVVKVIAAPPPSPTIVVPGPGPAPMVHVYGDPWVMQMANDGCPMVNDALLLENLPDGQTRYRWRGTDWAYLGPKPDPKARICTRNGRLAWWTPPKPRVLGPGVPEQSAPTPAPEKQGSNQTGDQPVFYSMTTR